MRRKRNKKKKERQFPKFRKYRKIQNVVKNIQFVCELNKYDERTKMFKN